MCLSKFIQQQKNLSQLLEVLLLKKLIISRGPDDDCVHVGPGCDKLLGIQSFVVTPNIGFPCGVGLHESKHLMVLKLVFPHVPFSAASRQSTLAARDNCCRRGLRQHRGVALLRF